GGIINGALYAHVRPLKVVRRPGHVHTVGLRDHDHLPHREARSTYISLPSPGRVSEIDVWKFRLPQALFDQQLADLRGWAPQPIRQPLQPLQSLALTRHQHFVGHLRRSSPSLRYYCTAQQAAVQATGDYAVLTRSPPRYSSIVEQCG